jgi:hypothetical protein
MKKKWIKNKRAGLALVLVISVLAFAAIIGFAMLSTASMQAQTTLNSNLALSADALADSGIDLACYYLVNPSKAPKTVPAGGFYDGGTISFGPNMPGSVDLAITSLGNNDYKIVSVGKAGMRNLSHTVTATVHIDPGFQVKSLVAFNVPAILPLTATINGDVQANGLLTNLGRINGALISPLSALGSGLILNGVLAPTDSNQMTIPTVATLTNYSTYTYRGKTYSAVTITGLPTGTTLGPSDTNPAGIFRYSGVLTMNHSVSITGTLIIENGDLNISGGGNVITPVDGFPAVIAKGNLFVRGPLLPSASPRDLTANGIVWVGGSMKTSGIVTNASLDIKGALLFGSGSVDPLFGARLTISANTNKTTNVNLATNIPPPSAKVLTYKQ